MNIRQKLTLGVAAIFMVTLTIVGVTYAYFVTRVTGALTDSANIQTAQVGEIAYQSGNGTGDLIEFVNEEPGAVKYKTFSVTNTDATASGDFKLYLTSTPDGTTNAEKPQFVHATSDTGCYPHTGDNAVTAASLYNSLGENISTNAAGTATAACFNGTAYNNLYITLYEVPASDTVTVDATGAITAGSLEATGVTTAMSETNVLANSGIVYTTATQYLNNNNDANASIVLAGGATRYYVLKVEYKNNGKNQNIENNAKVTLKVGIE